MKDTKICDKLLTCKKKLEVKLASAVLTVKDIKKGISNIEQAFTFFNRTTPYMRLSWKEKILLLFEEMKTRNSTGITSGGISELLFQKEPIYYERDNKYIYGLIRRMLDKLVKEGLVKKKREAGCKFYVYYR